MSALPASDSVSQELAAQFVHAIQQYREGVVDSRGLAELANNIVDAQAVAELDDELISHTYWAMRHLLHQPACWAAQPEELFYLERCLLGEEDFDQSFVDQFREE